MTTGAPPPLARKRSRARTLAPLGIAAYLVLEIWLLIQVGGAAGGLTVLALLVGAGVLGAVVVKRAGRRAFQSLTETLQQQQSGQAPTQDPKSTRNGLLMLGGLLLMLPGFVSDVAGLLLLVPPVRGALGRYADKALDRKMRSATAGSFGDAFQQARIHRPDGKVVQGEVIRDDGPSAQPQNGGPYGSEGPRPPLTP
ncbi:FxsA family membrane protein [Streptomyces purpureus]|uniref:FxsA family membrane protein n=1 Tax=Streptomyces purpureus TaxID=1951 RepID=UPI0003694732|nr:FxsA family membrane protein [Streptomyces purpureus]